ncbi:MAG TPA: FHA domain-containing protein [Spirochaetia bacterium]|nr:FHA domain-containing protein [Spirochaetia bacterium]
MALHLNVRPSPSQEYSWSHEGPIVRIGRSPECELRLSGDAHQTVSWEHAKIELRPGAAFVTDLGSSNGTYVNGQKIVARTLLREDDILSLGQSGPELTVVDIETTKANAAGSVGAHGTALVPAASSGGGSSAGGILTVPQGTAIAVGSKPASTTRLMLVTMQQRSRMTWFLATASAITAVSVILLLVHFQSRRVGRVSTTIAAHEQVIQETGKDIITVKDETKKLRGKVEEARKKINAISEADAANIHRKFAKAVYLVAFRVRGGGVQPMGTAFAISPLGVFATNAHVAQPVQMLLANRTNVLLISQGGVKQLRVASVECHPLYEDSDNVGYKTPDVAILRATLPGGQGLDSVVQLANEKELRELQIGSALCYIGFPQYQSEYASLDEVNARIYQGRLNRLLTMEEKRGEFANQHLIEHDMYSWSGASGSPIFNAKGKVVAVHFASNRVIRKMDVVGTKQSIVVADQNPAGPKWGMRVDLLREVYDP